VELPGGRRTCLALQVLVAAQQGERIDAPCPPLHARVLARRPGAADAQVRRGCGADRYDVLRHARLLPRSPPARGIARRRAAGAARTLSSSMRLPLLLVNVIGLAAALTCARALRLQGTHLSRFACSSRSGVAGEQLPASALSALRQEHAVTIVVPSAPLLPGIYLGAATYSGLGAKTSRQPIVRTSQCAIARAMQKECYVDQGVCHSLSTRPACSFFGAHARRKMHV
jgi:hypothetical protein